MKMPVDEHGASVPERIRRYIKCIIETSLRKDGSEGKKRAVAVAGRFRSGKNDISINHDRYLSEDIL